MSSCGTQSSMFPIAEAAFATLIPVCRAISSRSSEYDTSLTSVAVGTLPNRRINSTRSGNRTFGPTCRPSKQYSPATLRITKPERFLALHSSAHLRTVGSVTPRITSGIIGCRLNSPYV